MTQRCTHGSALTELDRRAGTAEFDRAMLVSQLASRIEVFEDRLRFEQALRSGIVASLEVMPPRPPAITVAVEG